MFITAIFTPLGIPIGTALAFIAFAGWAWPKPAEEREEERVDLEPAV
jgi:hypothetical protein